MCCSCNQFAEVRSLVFENKESKPSVRSWYIRYKRHNGELVSVHKNWPYQRKDKLCLQCDQLTSRLRWCLDEFWFVPQFSTLYDQFLLPFALLYPNYCAYTNLSLHFMSAGDFKAHPKDLIVAPCWLKAFKGNELQRLIRKKRMVGDRMMTLDRHNLEKRLRFLYKRFNRTGKHR